MGDAFIVRRGGGGAFAMILVNYPVGSTVTCTNSTGKKDISSSQTLFYIKKGVLPISCVVSITDGTRFASNQVTISYEGQSEIISLVYTRYLIANGVEQAGGTVVARKGNYQPTINRSIEGELYANIQGWSDGNSEGYIDTENAIDLTSYSKITLYFSKARKTVDEIEHLYISKTIGGSIEASVDVVNDTYAQTVVLNIPDECVGEYYITFKLYGRDTNIDNTYHIYDLYLE